MLALASEPKRRRMQENLEYEQQTAEALAVERREMCARLAQLDRESLRPFAMQSGGGRVLLGSCRTRLWGEKRIPALALAPKFFLLLNVGLTRTRAPTATPEDDRGEKA